ncbi:DASH family cryptochrome [Ralstonia sp. SET104]|uniref:DASH family cryptochrome n=1 Tax=Ralstonia sp. SET104 TaxID=2448774 RepID=UPI000F568526|nr:DASH family cryptochrome [Ralstonia sp. SET104]GCB04438.1 cryptochrome DASH [Ralstonia sp. SET104]
MSTVLFWFRNDLRLHDQAALRAACASGARYVVPVYCHADYDELTPWGFARVGRHRRTVLAAALRDVDRQLAGLGSRLLECRGPAAMTLPALARAVGATAVVCEEIAAPQEQAEVEALRNAGLQVHTVWQSSLLEPGDLPWAVHALPPTFTPFRQTIERANVKPPVPLKAPARVPPWPAGIHIPSDLRFAPASDRVEGGSPDARASFPYDKPAFDGGETAGLAHLTQYLARKLPHSYKRTRNGLSGVDYSSKWSPWLATGALSARRIMAELQQFETMYGANEGSYWLWFELLWRDYFRFLHLQHGRRLYRAQGLAQHLPMRHNTQGFERWCEARTSEPLVDAAMRELQATGYFSNRLRQVVASYLVYELGGDWRAGAAWFEAQLVDYDVYSNQGNWLYIAGQGTDPQGGRRFNIQKQLSQYDAEGQYLRLWGMP